MKHFYTALIALLSIFIISQNSAEAAVVNTSSRATVATTAHVSSMTNLRSVRNCDENEWGYNACTDELNLLDLFSIDMTYYCEVDWADYDEDYEDYNRGEYDILDFSYTSSSYSIQYRVHCGDGIFVEGGAYVSHYDWGDEGYGLADFIMNAFVAMGDAHEPYGVPASDLAEIYEEDLREEIEAKKKQEAWDDAHDSEGTDIDDDEDSDTDDDDDDTDTDTDTDFIDDDSDWCDQPFVLC